MFVIEKVTKSVRQEMKRRLADMTNNLVVKIFTQKKSSCLDLVDATSLSGVDSNPIAVQDTLDASSEDEMQPSVSSGVHKVAFEQSTGRDRHAQITRRTSNGRDLIGYGRDLIGFGEQLCSGNLNPILSNTLYSTLHFV